MKVTLSDPISWIKWTLACVIALYVISWALQVTGLSAWITYFKNKADTSALEPLPAPPSD